MAPVTVPVDQGFAWIVMMASFLSQAVIYGIGRGAPGVLYVIFLQHLQFRSPPQVALGLSLETALMFFVSPFAGVLVNLYGCRRVGILGGLLSSVGLVLTLASADVYCMIVTLGIITGVGFGLSYIAAMAAIALHFDKYRHVAFGIATSGVGVGTLTFPIIIQELESLYGWRGCLLISSAIAFHQVAASATFPSKQIIVINSDPQGRPEQHVSAVNLRILRNTEYLFIGFSMLFYTSALSMIYVHFSAYAKELGFSPTECSLLYTAIGVAGFLGRYMYLGVLHCTALPPVLLHMLGAVVCCGASILLPITDGYISLQIYAVVFGVLTSSIGSLVPLIISDILGPGMVASGYGYALVFSGVGQTAGGPLADLIADWQNTYVTSLFLSGTSFFVSSLLMVYPTVRRFKERKLPEADDNTVNT